MPPRLSSPPDPQDPLYQRLERKINLMLHVALFACINSTLWFLSHFWHLAWLGLLTASWGTVLITHTLWVVSKREE